MSTDVSEWSRYITEYYGIDKYFKYRIISGDVHYRKPDPQIYRIALKQIQALADECLFVDDSIANILSAQMLGIPSILFNRYNEQYSGEQVDSFDDLNIKLQHP